MSAPSSPRCPPGSVALSSNLEELQTWVRTFCEARDWDQFHSMKDLAIGLVTESAELLELFRFKSDLECGEMLGVPERRVRIEDELADVLFFVLRFAQLNQIDLKSILADKIAKNAVKYPVATSRGSNRKYNDES